MKDKILNLIFEQGGIDGVHHKHEVLDQIVRILTEDEEGYKKWVAEYENGEYGPGTYTWIED